MIPLSTTLISVRRVPADSGGAERDLYDEQPEAEVVRADVRANISSPSGRERNMGGTQEVIEFSLSCDPVDLRNTDQVEDQATGEVYEVVWSKARVGFGLEHTRAGLRRVVGTAS